MFSWHSLWLGLRRYLIIFGPLAFALDQQTQFWQMLSHSIVFDKSKDFTSYNQIHMPPTIPVAYMSSLHQHMY